MAALGFVIAVLAIVLFAVWRALVASRRHEYIRSFTLPKGLFEKLLQQHPQLTLKDCQLVAQALRQFFGAYLRGGRRYVSMPSQVADDLWHEFILTTRHYETFCRQAFGGFLHHTPAAVLGSQRQSNEGLRRCWWHCCRAENINPRTPTRLPLLFAIDAKLNIEGGFRYAANCQPAAVAAAAAATGSGSTPATVVYCGGDFASASFDGGTDGFGEGNANGGSDGGADGGGGDGGSGSGGGGGCGGGCGS